MLNWHIDVGVGELRRIIDLVYTGETTTWTPDDDDSIVRDLLNALGIVFELERVEGAPKPKRKRTLNTKYLSDSDEEREIVPVPPVPPKQRRMPSSIVSKGRVSGSIN